MEPGHQSGGGTRKIPGGQGNLEREWIRVRSVSASLLLACPNSRWCPGSPWGESPEGEETAGGGELVVEAGPGKENREEEEGARDRRLRGHLGCPTEGLQGLKRE